MNEIEAKTSDEFIYIDHICKEITTEFKKKNIAYGDSFGKQFKEFGHISALVRISDKYSRIKALLLGAKNEVRDESIKDTLQDLACYCLMTMYELNDQKKST